jgi:hypothetical protein
MREFHWMKKVRRSTVAAGWNGESIPSGIGDLGFDLMHGPAAFDDGGAHVVLETVDGLEWAIVDVNCHKTLKKVSTDFNEAVMWCRLFNEAEDK